MDSIHIVDKRFHSLMHTGYSLVDSVLLIPFIALETVEVFSYVILDVGIIEMVERSPGEFFEFLHFLYI